MKTLVLAAILTLLAAPAIPQTSAPAKESPMTHASGTFDVKSAPTDHAPDPSLGSYSLDKVYHGDLEATGKGEMLSAGDPSTGNAGYVAIERIAGTLGGPSGTKTGTFAVMQMGTMSTGTAPQLTATIVPGSGTGDLSGIYGSMTIALADGKHNYTLDYAFAK